MPAAAATASGPGRRAGLDPDEVVATALALVEAGGPEALTMRKLAAELGVGTNTIYWHVGSREELIAALGLKPALGHTNLPEGLTANLRTDGTRDFVFVQNYMPEAQAVDVGAGGVSLLTREPVSGTITLPARGIEIFERKA